MIHRLAVCLVLVTSPTSPSPIATWNSTRPASALPLPAKGGDGEAYAALGRDRAVAPSTPAAERALEFMSLVNRNDRPAARVRLARMLTPKALETGPVEERVDDLSARYEASRGLDLVSIQKQAPSDATVIFRNRLTGRLGALRVRTEPAAPFRITTIADAPPPQQPRADGLGDARALAAHLDAFVTRLTEGDGFSGVVLLARGDEIILHKAYGQADRNIGAPNTLDTRIRHASITKMFTALAVAQLVEAGKLSWDDPVARFVPYPDPESAKAIRIKHLLSHTAGLGNFVNNPEFENTRAQGAEPLEDLLRISGSSPPRYPPGSSGGYSNTGYLLAGRIVEIASGEPYRGYVARHIFGPAGMTESGFPTFSEIGKKLATGYQVQTDDGGRRVEGVIPLRRGHPAGSSYGTALDLFRFSQALRSGKLVSADTLDLMTTPVPWVRTRYGYGFWMGRDAPASRRVYGHPGNTTGGCTNFDVITDAGEAVTAVVLANSSTLSCIPVVEEIYHLVPPTPG